MRPMNAPRGKVDQQLEEAYRDGSALGRIAAGLLLAVALGVLFIYRAATSDPLWESERAASEATAQ